MRAERSTIRERFTAIWTLITIENIIALFADSMRNHLKVFPFNSFLAFLFDIAEADNHSKKQEKDIQIRLPTVDQYAGFIEIRHNKQQHECTDSVNPKIPLGFRWQLSIICFRLSVLLVF